ncbi:MAG: hypothetical protein ABR609_07565 [Acidimicrobiia bacterium]
MAAFAERALDAHEDLVVATGMCDAQTGIGDAFLPFREILELLTGNVDSKLAQGRITDENAGLGSRSTRSTVRNVRTCTPLTLTSPPSRQAPPQVSPMSRSPW